MFKNSGEILVQIIAEQQHSDGRYVHADTEYFDQPNKLQDWISGAVEWADRFRIFKVGQSNFFFEGIVVGKNIPKWEKIKIDDLTIVDLFV
jgi:hypothetical protein